MSRFLVLDIATAPIPDAAQFIEPVSAPSNYKKQEAIDAYVKEKEAEQADRAGLDIDLCRITGIGWHTPECPERTMVALLKDEQQERDQLEYFGAQMAGHTLISYNGLKFDWPILMRRAMYLGVSFPTINLDRYRSNHIDLFAKLTNNGVLPGKALRFYASRLGWLDLEKTLTGAEEAQIFQHQKWSELEASIRHDVTATARLAQWMKLL